MKFETQAGKLNGSVTKEAFDQILCHISAPLVRSMTLERVALTMDRFFRARTRDL